MSDLGDLVTVETLQGLLDDPALLVLDASWHMPASGRDARAEWRQCRIPSAGFFDFDREICALNNALPHMMPSAEQFSEQVRALGVCQDSKIVLYDSLGVFSAPRAWWMFKSMGHKQVAVLDGGLPAWQAAGLSLDELEPPETSSPGDFIATASASHFVGADEVLAAISKANCCLIDARSADRFYARVPEPREGLRRGHIPSAKNLPFDQLLSNGRLLGVEALRERFAELAEPSQHLLLSCGSGVSACVLALGAYQAGYAQVSVYDGSWCEWGAPGPLPIE